MEGVGGERVENVRGGGAEGVGGSGEETEASKCMGKRWSAELAAQQQ